jgi:predicted nucleic acid-binding Zn ribbon protein
MREPVPPEQPGRSSSRSPESSRGPGWIAARTARRAKARAGRSCPVCGDAVAAERSTRRYCSERCKAAAGRRRPRVRRGLLPAQVRILEVLAEMWWRTAGKWGEEDGGGCICRRQIAERSGVGVGHMGDLIGRVRPSRRSEAEARTGIVSLLTLGCVEEVMCDIDGKSERCYQITAAGRKALADER